MKPIDRSTNVTRTRGVNLTPEENAIVERLAGQRKWTVSQTIAEMVRTSSLFGPRPRRQKSTSKPTATKTEVK